MVFASPLFVFAFMPLVFVLNLAAMKLFAGSKAKNGVMASNILLLAASLVFYAWGEPYYIFLMIGVTLLCYIFALLIEKQREKEQEAAGKKAKILLAVTITVSLLTLCIFKYASFLTGRDLGIALPLGISFYTFQALSYVIDVYRGQAKAQKNFAKLLLYVSLFPQLVAGPIVRYRDIDQQIDYRTIDAENVAKGLERFIFGLGKKVVIANTAAVVVDGIFGGDVAGISSPAAIATAICYVLQIYFDFSGYSDMAIGLGGMFGFRINENFMYPYSSLSIKEFWRRWHISLSTWFKNYLYIPLGGNRKGRARTVINKLVVFFFTGLWHGANFTFILWGLWHGLFLLLEEYIPFLKSTPKGFMKVVRYIYTMAVVTIGFAMFRADTVAEGAIFISRIFTGGFSLSEIAPYFDPYTITVLVLGLVFALPVKDCIRKIAAKVHFERGAEAAGFVLAALVFVFSAMCLAANSYNPFIYFRF